MPHSSSFTKFGIAGYYDTDQFPHAGRKDTDLLSGVDFHIVVVITIYQCYKQIDSMPLA